ncbi:MAG: hypothetical protein G3M78_14015 [Candidatus Nitrohelix vancouverensis]|uniref:Lipoprotein n=1 Tax=Candidatus Nitrohelix vancouverensis TaxID=2705534 RepID=A0A7T0G4L6_9BACT|nr:MAG: hypothetical protein G3M78_14015 [Candidatus Nitrohelix vancouverensis]
MEIKNALTKNRYMKFCLLATFSLLFLQSQALAIPMGSANSKGQGEVSGDWMFHPKGEETHPSHYPNTARSSQRIPSGKFASPEYSDQINEPHPIPAYIEKMSPDGKFPSYYKEIINTQPEDHVQAKIFNESEFKKIRKIWIRDFENKTLRPFRDASAGSALATMMTRTLQSGTAYTIIPPTEDPEDIELKIISPVQSSQAELNDKQETPGAFPYANDKTDAVMIGAVTKYADTYINKDGGIETSATSVLEFGAYLINSKTGDVIWGARYLSKGATNLPDWFQTGGGQSKEEHSQQAMKKIIKTFVHSKYQRN